MAIENIQYVYDNIPYLAPQNMFNLAFLERQKCSLGLLIDENR